MCVSHLFILFLCIWPNSISKCVCGINIFVIFFFFSVFVFLFLSLSSEIARVISISANLRSSIYKSCFHSSKQSFFYLLNKSAISFYYFMMFFPTENKSFLISFVFIFRYFVSAGSIINPISHIIVLHTIRTCCNTENNSRTYGLLF